MLGGEKLLQDCRRPVPVDYPRRARALRRALRHRARRRGRHNFVDHARVDNVLAAAKGGDTHAHMPQYIGYDAYVGVAATGS